MNGLTNIRRESGRYLRALPNQLRRSVAPLFCKRAALSAAAVALLTTTHVGVAAQLSLSQAPLFVTTSVEPNVMLLIDTSGSMNNVIWASGYNNTTTYTSWGFTSTNGNIHYSSITDCTTSGLAGKQGTDGTTTKCLVLPDPVGGGATRFNGNYLNYLFSTYADGTNLTTGTIPNDYRMNVARTVATNLVTNTPGVRFGVSRFYGDSSLDYGDGATVSASCGSTALTITTAISGYASENNTPLAEAYYELTRYFRGLSSYYHANLTYTSPLQYRCQKNFIIVITDGLPTVDDNFPSDDPADTADTSHSLPDWDGQAPTTTAAQYPTFPQYSDGFQSGSNWDEGYTLYLDDFAKFGYDTDLMTSGNDNAGISWNSIAYPKQNIETYTVGFAAANQMLEDAAAYGHGTYYTADNSSQLTNALSGALTDIEAKTASAAAVAVNSRSLNTNSHLYQGLFINNTWSGDLLSYAIDATGTINSTPTWSAKSRLASATWTNRAIITRNSSTGIPFRWTISGANALSSNMQAVLNRNPATSTTDAYGTDRLEFLRGNAAQEGAGTAPSFRTRTGGFKLGDIANSAPLYIGSPVFVANIEDVAHSTFRDDYSDRREMVYVGANDGMFHGFDADTGDEKIAYVPSFIFNDTTTPANPNYNNGVHHLTNPTYSHRYYVDASPTAADAYGIFTNVSGQCTTGCWRTVLIGGVGGGGKGYFALDITDPDGGVSPTLTLAFSENNASRISLWEFTDSASGDMGYTYGEATITKVRTSSSTTVWAAVFGNGYNSINERAYLYVVNAVTGAQIAKILLPDPVADAAYPGTKYANGLSTPAIVDKDEDYVADYVYAGDLKGNLWKIDLTDNDPTKWDSYYQSGNGASQKPAPMYTAQDSAGNRLPITARPEIGLHPTGEVGFMAYFGTGRYIATTDSNPNAPPDGSVSGTPIDNSFNGVWDPDNSTSAATTGAVASSRLRTQTLSTQTVSGQTVRVVSNNTISGWGSSGTACNSGGNCMGWTLDLLATGERSVSKPVLLGGATPRIIFTTLIPDSTPCNFGGTGWLMELNPTNGGKLAKAVFDLDNNGIIDSNDEYLGGSVAGINPDNGILPDPVIMRDSPKGKDLKLLAGSKGAVVAVKNYVGKISGGRQSWRQLQ
ncbi:MAG: hypothetical protein HY308_17800 [Gammaproteobacteria bacterium]|nr:hypothetical protein [Gammaproteobacteria bacterium]